MAIEMDTVDSVTTGEPADEWETIGRMLLGTTMAGLTETMRELTAAQADGSITRLDYLLELDAACATVLAELDLLVEHMSTPPNAEWSANLEGGRRAARERRAAIQNEMQRLRPSSGWGSYGAAKLQAIIDAAGAKYRRAGQVKEDAPRIERQEAMLQIDEASRTGLREIEQLIAEIGTPSPDEFPVLAEQLSTVRAHFAENYEFIQAKLEEW